MGTGKEALVDAAKEKVLYIFSIEAEQEWENLRECMADDTLRNLNIDGFNMQMRAACLQLIGGAHMRALGGPAAMLRDPMSSLKSSMALQAHIVAQPSYTPELKAACQVYNSAYGSSSSSGIEAMVAEFGRNTINDELPPQVARALVEYFVSLWRSWVVQFSS